MGSGTVLRDVDKNFKMKLDMVMYLVLLDEM